MPENTSPRREYIRSRPAPTAPPLILVRRLGAKLAGTSSALAAPGEFFERLVGDDVQRTERGGAALRTHLQLSRNEFPRLVIAAMREHPAHPFQHDIHIGDRT